MNYKKLIFKFLLGCLFVSLIAFTFFVYQFFKMQKQIDTNLQKSISKEMDYATNYISNHFQKFKKLVSDFRQIIDKKKLLSEKELYNLIEDTVKKNQDLHGLVLAYEPGIFEKKDRFSIFIIRSDNLIEPRPIQYDYTLPRDKKKGITSWYYYPINFGPSLTEPYWGTAIKGHVIAYGEPLYAPNPLKDAKPIGAISALHRLDNVRSMVNNLSLGKRGYAFVISEIDGKFASHPIEEYYRNDKSIFDVAKERKNKDLERVGYEILKNKQGKTSFVNEKTGQKAIIYYKPIPQTNLILCVVAIQDEVWSQYNDFLRKYRVLLIAFLILFLFFLIFILTKSYLGSLLNLSIASILASILLIVGIISLWHIQRKYGQEKNLQNIVVLDKNTIDNVIKSSKEEIKDNSPLYLVKTGILIRSIESSFSTNDVQLSGFVWQKYPLLSGREIQRDFIINECDRYDEKRIIHTEKNSKEELIVWRFNGVFDSDQALTVAYPLDKYKIVLTIDHPSLDKNILFIPDLEGYQFINPQSLPGINVEDFSQIWNIEKSYFSFKPIDLKANLGVEQPKQNVRRYLLDFSISATRNIVDPLIMYFLPLLVSLLLLFINLLAVRKENIITNITLISGIFVGLIFAHSALRRSFFPSGIFYLEYFYIIPYLVIVLLLVDMIFYAQKYKIAFISYKNNLLVKVFFWPAFLLIMFLISVFIFY
ncbi:TPA: hypothetical protein DEO28_02870 [Candidatus Dependentiae bacterium]|nr:MAG: hypothetical protein UR14_C0005G0075 [candidate division TM6 bacterium GW2011_GWE2_31_21]KKP53151.1 MAG: hypothetical protein UR43_C0007G0075 [candidate division TM6 bacterium GW2011_GWF2_33_332]HBS47970.1 hypothetical protein [Candidatus Dependentiae bacterium]HBZ73426.1 hypothetical protein [Candidatus Dependentiae bacterium]